MALANRTPDAGGTGSAAKSEPLIIDGKRITFFTVFPGVALAFFLGQMDQSIVATALPAIAKDLNGFSNISWVVIAYLLCQTVTVPIWGRLSDLYGRRIMLVLALSMLIVASALCAMASSLGMLILARAFQGLGGGGLHTLSAAIIAEVVRPRERAKYQGYLASIFLAANSCGPVIGGFLSEQWGWRSVFWVQIPVGIIALLLAVRLPRLGRATGAGLSYDYIGTALFIAAATSLLYCVTMLGEANHLPVLLLGGLAVLGLVCALAFARYEKIVPTPFLSPVIVSDPTIWRAMLSVAFYAASLIATIIFVPLYLQVARGFGPAEAGFVLLPLSAAAITASTVCGQLISRTGRTTIFPLCGLPCAVIGELGLALTVVFHLSGWWAFPMLMIIGIGGGTVMTTSMFIAQSSVETVHLGAATSAVNFGRAIGGAVGAAIISAILFASLTLIDPEAGALMQKLVGHGTEALNALPPAERTAVTNHFGAAFTIAFSALAVFPMASWFMMLKVPRRRI